MPSFLKSAHCDRDVLDMSMTDSDYREWEVEMEKLERGEFEGDEKAEAYSAEK